MLGRPYFIGNKLTFLIEMTAFLDANYTHSSNPLCNVMNADNPFVKNTAVLFISAKQHFHHTKYKYLGIFFVRDY